MADRFPELSENDSTSLVDRNNSENNKKGTKSQRISKVSQEKEGRWRVTRVIDAKDKLANAYVLKRFYAEARKKNGELYTKALLMPRVIERLTVSTIWSLQIWLCWEGNQLIGAITRLCKAARAYGFSETKTKNKLGDRMIKQLLTSVIAKYRDLSVSRRSIICLSLRLRQIVDLLDTDKSRYFAQPRPIVVKYFPRNTRTVNNRELKHATFFKNVSHARTVVSSRF